ncbi:MAG: copper resistance CopC family protein [Candidatus Puniceispirillaceae bacterium]|jgi:methionine-rich copper-binding protein CopC
MPFRSARYAIPVIGFFLSMAAKAHAPLTALTPADGARLTTPPAVIEIRFRDPLRLIRFDLAVENGNGGAADIPLGDSHLMAEAVDHAIALPVLADGRYTAKWRALGEDGHVIKGRFSFTIAPE